MSSNNIKRALENMLVSGELDRVSSDVGGKTYKVLGFTATTIDVVAILQEYPAKKKIILTENPKGTVRYNNEKFEKFETVDIVQVSIPVEKFLKNYSILK